MQVADHVDMPQLPLGRTYSVPASSRKNRSSRNSPREFPIRRADSIEDISELDENIDIKELENQVFNLKEQISSYKTVNSELNESLDVTTSLLHKEK